MTLGVDARVGDFRICGVIGEGAMGEVYLAQDMVLGRRVALKLIKPDLMDANGFARFMEEARTTASFNHPHIVTLHSFGEHHGRPYLALEHVDGESLRDRLQRGPLPVSDALRYTRSVALALVEAHRSGLVHADLKPENVMIGRDGRIRVLDFGLAKLSGGRSGAASGTPAYMAPERWRQTAPSGAIDIWAIGIMLHELVVGARPIADGDLASLPFGKLEIRLPDAPWAELAARCLARAPTNRPTAEQLVEDLTGLLDRRAAQVEPTRSPFPGLAAFTRDDAHGYFGRAMELDAIVEQLHHAALLPITGPSGVGKTSFVRAAVISRLEQSASWIVVEWRPGNHPFAALSAALAEHGCVVSSEALRLHPDSLSLRLHALARERGARVLVFVDQFEELFTLGATDAERICDCLANAASVEEPWRIVLTVRDDFFGRLAGSVPLRAHLGNVFPLSAMGIADLRAAITGPLANVGYSAERPELVARIIGDVATQPACLPLLQFACAMLWDRRDQERRLLLEAEYDAFGGATGALASHADRCLAELSGEEVRIARTIMLALVGPDGTRRPRPRAELIDGLPPVAERVLDRLLERRLLVAMRDAEAGARVEVAHEAIATTWPRFARWLDETHEERVMVAEIEQAAALWERRGRRDVETWVGPGLAEAVRKIDQWNVELRSVSRAFIEAGIDHAARGRRRRRWLVATVGAALGIAAVAATATAVVLARRKREADARHATERLIAADRGAFDLELAPFDWDPVTQTARPPTTRPVLHWRLRSRDGDRLYEGDELLRAGGRWAGDVWIERVEARSGAALLEVERGACPPSVLLLQRLPGYHERTKPVVLRVAVPTCAASAADMIEIPAGEFVSNVDADNEGGWMNKAATLSGFALDRTEVTRGAFEVYEQMAALTGDSAAPAPHLDIEKLGGPRLPIVGVSFATARSYCRFLGKDLPTIEQWQKAVRGGVTLPNGPNPAPDRDTPWIAPRTNRPTNVVHPNQPVALVAVASFPDDQSPYGIFDLAGNVLEWTLSRPPVTSPFRDLRIVAGAGWSSPVELGQYRVRWRNTRPDRYLDFTLGFRCAR